MPQTEKQCDQAMKYGQFIEYNMRNIFLEKPYKKCGGEASPRNVIQAISIACPSGGLPKHIKTKLLTTCLNLCKAFVKVFLKKKRSRTSLPSSFLA